jgi:dTDP-glucose 4,6-dehydratase
VRILVTGGAGFIGSALVRHLLSETRHEVLNVDRLAFAGVPASLDGAGNTRRYAFRRGDICNADFVRGLFGEFQPDVVAHLAAETHVDRSIDDPAPFIETNVVGTFTLLECALRYWRSTGSSNERFRFHHVSTDEVYGSLGKTGHFVETTPYDPRSPYSATKAASDHLVRAWHTTYGLPVSITNASNTYGPNQLPEKLIPRTIVRALNDLPLQVYGAGDQVRDWLFVDDHARALRLVFEGAAIGETYNIGGNAERRNIDVVRQICAILDRFQPRSDGSSHSTRIEFVKDRPGHDQRCAVSTDKIAHAFGWAPQVPFEVGLEHTVTWYLENREWWEPVLAGQHGSARLGLRFDDESE